MEARISVAKIGKYASSESGDTLEMIERPNGGISLVLADGQWSGKSAKAISNVVTRKAISLLADGVRDGAAARAASDYLYTYRSGKVQATLNILSIDLQTKTLVVTRNNPAPIILIRGREIETLDQSSRSVGSRLGIKPNILEIALEPGLVVIAFTDGLLHAGDRAGKSFDIKECLSEFLSAKKIEPMEWSDLLLAKAVDYDQGRPSDDITVVVMAVFPKDGDSTRRMSVYMPLG
jgi:serine phosphatase RsbU (regulator of sigma subunit)